MWCEVFSVSVLGALQVDGFPAQKVTKKFNGAFNGLDKVIIFFSFNSWKANRSLFCLNLNLFHFASADPDLDCV